MGEYHGDEDEIEFTRHEIAELIFLAREDEIDDLEGEYDECI